MARRSSSQLRAKNAAPMASSTAAAFQGDAARNEARHFNRLTNE